MARYYIKMNHCKRGSWLFRTKKEIIAKGVYGSLVYRHEPVQEELTALYYIDYLRDSQIIDFDKIHQIK